jgi:hypothetical protein
MQREVPKVYPTLRLKTQLSSRLLGSHHIAVAMGVKMNRSYTSLQCWREEQVPALPLTVIFLNYESYFIASFYLEAFY